ncbi:hypothetical protein HDU91_000460 [Kappamyces sp. JEL0680]|nr:hypothetical protein HDU91_000460 [Kappamyces sp. JEL0680]
MGRLDSLPAIKNTETYLDEAIVVRKQLGPKSAPALPRLERPAEIFYSEIRPLSTRNAASREEQKRYRREDIPLILKMIYHSTYLNHQHTEIEKVVKKLHESLNADGLREGSVPMHSPPSHYLKSTFGLQEELQEPVLERRRLVMTGQKIKTYNGRPETTLEALRSVRKMPKESERARMDTAESVPTARLLKSKTIGLKERALLESMAAVGISRMLRVTSQYEYHQLQQAQYQMKQLQVTRAKVDGKSSAV